MDLNIAVAVLMGGRKINMHRMGIWSPAFARFVGAELFSPAVNDGSTTRYYRMSGKWSDIKLKTLTAQRFQFSSARTHKALTLRRSIMLIIIHRFTKTRCALMITWTKRSIQRAPLIMRGQEAGTFNREEMNMFRVHFDIDGERRSVVVRAENPDKAAASVRRDYPGAFVVKVKVDKS